MTIYDEFLNEVFKGSLFEISSLQHGNFVVQALVASAKTNDHVRCSVVFLHYLSHQ